MMLLLSAAEERKKGINFISARERVCVCVRACPIPALYFMRHQKRLFSSFLPVGLGNGREVYELCLWDEIENTMEKKPANLRD